MQYAAEADSDGDNEYVIDEEGDALPFSCLICRESFVKPVMTRCKHYFCESCALTRFVKDPRCAVCKENTNGIFNVAQDIIKKADRIAAKAETKKNKKKKIISEDQQQDNEKNSDENQQESEVAEATNEE